MLDEQAHIAQLLDDLTTVRAAGHEVIVVDGGSSDASVDLARPLADRVIGAPRGRARQMNAAAAQADGEVLWFVHADSRVPGAAADALLAALANGRAWGRFDVRLSGRQPMLRVVERMMNLRSCITSTATGDQGIFVQRQAFLEVGGFPDLPLMEDIALSRRLRRLSRAACVHRPRLLTSSRRWEQRGIGRTILLMWWLRLAYALGVPPERLAVRYR